MAERQPNHTTYTINQRYHTYDTVNHKTIIFLLQSYLLYPIDPNNNLCIL